MSFLIDNQLPLILAAFLLGLLGALLVHRSGRRSLWGRMADLVWVGLGGLGALAAILSGIYQDDRTRLDRQVDVAYSVSRGFEADAARFRLAYCDAGPAYATAAEPIRALCDRVELLHASTARARRLPIFLEVSQTAEPLKALRLFLAGPEPAEMAESRAEALAFDAAELLAFAARTPATEAATAVLAARPLTVGIAAEYRVISATYEDLIGTLERLVEDWRYLQGHSLVLTLQVVALCLIAFAAPFRLGKSVADFG
jgi:hypothetical protein